MNWTLFLSLMLLASLVCAELPSDQIKHISPPEVISLQNVDPTSAQAIAADHPKLAKEPRWNMADIGYMSSEITEAVQGNEGLAGANTSFLGGIPAIPPSVGNGTENMTVINGTMMWF